ncbi:MAG: hypothetical protein CK424_02975 [Legionella sp.]|nr:MAG: hypothetical protein CK424_02975 [Legionella sp.]
MTRRLFLDFDGTLVDSRQRQYNLFLELAPECNVSFNDYWEYKRKDTKQDEILGSLLHYSNLEIISFKNKWLEMIEESTRLRADVVIQGVHDFLERSNKTFDLCLITGRQNSHLLINQMKRLELFYYFKYVLNTAQKVSKAEKISSILQSSPSDVFIGDTAEDILAGKELGVYTIAVKTGSLNAHVLESYNPDLLVDSVNDIDLSSL